MYKRHHIRALAHSARFPDARCICLDTINGTEEHTGHADIRATRFARVLWQLVHRMRSAESF